jgi:hypothetical protein
MDFISVFIVIQAISTILHNYDASLIQVVNDLMYGLST